MNDIVQTSNVGVILQSMNQSISLNHRNEIVVLSEGKE